MIAATAGRRSRRRYRHLGWAAAFAAVCLVSQVIEPVAAAHAASNPAASYTYDADGRLATVTAAAGNVATYSYDAVGNVKSVTVTPAGARQSTALKAHTRRLGRPEVTSVSQGSARVGQRVTITGSGFSPQRAADVVRIGSLLATVVAASSSRLTIAAPPGSGGQVSVRTPGGSSTHGTLAIRGAPRSAGPVRDARADLRPLHAPAGVTALAGQIENARGSPLQGVRVSVSGGAGRSGASTVTNPGGQFLLRDLSAGRHMLTIDGSSLPGGRDYGIYTEPVELPAGRTSVLPWISYLTAIDTTHAITIASPTRREVTLTTPRIPGLKVLIPAGTVIHSQAGKIVRSLSITPLPTNRTPMPWGPGMIPQFFTIQPGGATISGQGLQVIYPNTAKRPPGEAVAYLAEDPAWPGTGWWRYGTGHVSANGREIIPTIGTRYKTTNPGGNATLPAPGKGPPAGSECSCGDPVDLATGLFVDQATDISLPDIQGVTVTRSFRQLDNVVRDFGIGGSDSLNLYVIADSAGNYDLTLPDGGSVKYTPTNTTGVYQAVNSPTDYAGSVLTETNSDPDGPFTLKLRNGTQMAFGDPAYLTAITDRFGNTVDINRTGATNGQIKTVTTPSGRWLSFTYGVCVSATSTKCITQITDNSGRTVTYQYDANGRLIKVTNVDGGVTTNGWANCTNATTCTELTSITDPLGRVTKITYGTNGTVSQQTQPNSGTWKYQYTLTKGKITNVIATDPDGNQSSTSFAANGYATSNTVGYGTSLAETSTSTYEPNTGLVASTTDALGRTTSYTYDALGNPLSITVLAGTPQAATTTYTYEPVYNRLASVTDPLGNTTSYTYNDQAGTETITNPRQKQTVITLNDRGQIVSTRDPLGGITYYSYLSGDLVATADPLGNVSATYYDSAGRPLQVTDPDGNTTMYTYDAAGNKLTSTDPLGNTTHLAYDADGDLTSYTDASGNATHYTYDSLGDMATVTDPLGKTDKWTYDPDGNLLTSTDRDGNVTNHAYDALGRLTTTAYGVNGAQNYDTVNTTYDQANRPTQVVDSLTGTYSYTYGNLNDILQYSSPQGSISYTYNNGGQRTGMTVSGQPAISYTYDADGNLISLTQGSASASYTYDDGGNLKAVTLPNGVTETDTYDAASNLMSTTATTSGGSTIGSAQYTYDSDGRITTANGSLVTAALPVAVASETYNADNELTAINGTNLSYDADGSLTSDGSNTYTWNPLGQLSSVITATATYSYGYSPAGQRVSVTTGGVTTSSLYDGSTLVRQSSGGSAIANYLSGGPDGTLQIQNSTGTSVPLYNQTASTTQLTNSTGQIATTYTYDPPGNTTVSGTPNANPERYAASLTNPTGLDLMGSRYYDPAIGRFISQDPLGLAAGSPNLYEYAGDDPVDLNDPSGLSPLSVVGHVAADMGVGAINGLTFGIFHLQPPYCGPGLGFAFALGDILGNIAAGVILGGVGGAVLDGIGGALEAADATDVAIDLAADETDSVAAQAARTAADAANAGGTRVIGHYPAYVELAQETGAKSFSVPTDVWDPMTPEEQWSANQTFLDRGIANGETFRLATPIEEMRIPSAYANEVNYLLKNGYTLNSAGDALVPGG
jgi:RHS repeat-associated protein